MKNYARKLIPLLIIILASNVYAQVEKSKPNVWVYSDMSDPRDLRKGGHPRADPDDLSSLASFLLSANRFHIESIVIGSGAFPNLSDPLPFINEVFVPAYQEHISNLNGSVSGYQRDISYQWSSVTRTGTPRKFNYKHDYKDLTDYETVRSLVDYARDNKVYVLVWGSLTEPAILVKHLMDTGQKDVLDNITIIAHWSKSYVKSMHKKALTIDPFKVTNSNMDRKASLYVHQQAEQNKIKMIQLGCVGQTGIVDGSKNYSRIEEFNKSRLGQIFMSAKYYGGKADQSDAATYWILAKDLGFDLQNDYPHNGGLTKELELQNIDKFKRIAPSIMDDLLKRSKASSGEAYKQSFVADYFTYCHYRYGKYHVYSPYSVSFKIRSADGELLKQGTLRRSNNSFTLPRKSDGNYKVELIYPDKTVHKRM